MKRASRVLRGVCRALLIPAVIAGCAFAQSVEEMRLTVGKSIVLDYPADIRQISTSDPAIVDAIAVSTREVLLHAKGVGNATVVVWARSGERTIYSIAVEQNLEALRRLLRDTFPNENIQVLATRDSVSLTGKVSTKDVADRAVALVTPFGKSIVNNLEIAPAPIEKQIMLRVKFAELNRRAAQSFGVNLLATGAAGTIGRITTGQFSAPAPSSINTNRTATQGNSFSITDALNVFAFRPDLNLAAFIQALQTQNLLQILAEPNLVTINGREASFLVGGEFPVPVLQGGGNAGAVTIQFREFGIRLTFTPTVTANNTIRMYVKPEVSTIDVNNSINLSGFLIPALATRRMETNVELSEGQSFVIAGLIDNRVQQSMSRIPGLSNIPLLGTLFKSTDIQKNQAELVVMVTPEFTRALAPGEPVSLPGTPLEYMPQLSPNTQPASGADSRTRGAVEEAQQEEKKAKKS